MMLTAPHRLLRASAFCILLGAQSLFATEHQQSELVEQLRVLSLEEKSSIKELVLKLPDYQNYKRHEVMFDATTLTGAGLSMALGLKAYATLIEDGIKTMFAHNLVDNCAQYLEQHPALYPTAAITTSLFAGLIYAVNRLKKPFVLDGQTEMLISGYEAAQGTRHQLQRTATELTFDRNIITQENHEIITHCLDESREALKKLLEDLTKQQKSTTTYSKNDTQEITQLLQQSHDLTTDLDTLQEKKKIKKQVTFTDPLENVSRTLVTSLGLSILQQHGQNKNRLFEQLTPDALKIAGLCGTLGLMASSYAKNRSRQHYHQKIMNFLEQREKEEREKVSEKIIDNGIESLTAEQEMSRIQGQRTLLLNDPVRQAFQLLKSKKAQEDDATEDSLLENYKALLNAVKIIVDAYSIGIEVE